MADSDNCPKCGKPMRDYDEHDDNDDDESGAAKAPGGVARRACGNMMCARLGYVEAKCPACEQPLRLYGRERVPVCPTFDCDRHGIGPDGKSVMPAG